jgi:hypothetical protein
MTEVIEQRQSRDAKLADAYTDLEAPIRDLERCAIIADRFITDPSEEDEELFHFAVQQRTWRLGNLSTPNSVQKLQMALHAKAKA